MDDETLIGYCEIHCETERALFSAEHIKRMAELAGNPSWMPYVYPKQFLSMHESMAELCRLARERRKPKPTAVIIPFPLALTHEKPV